MKEKLDASIWLEEMHISGDTEVTLDHFVEDDDPLKGSAIMLHDLLDEFLEANASTRANKETG